MHFIYLLTTQPQRLDIVKMILNARGLVLLDLIVLMCFSVLTWYIIVYKGIFYLKAARNNRAFLGMFRSGATLEQVYEYCEQHPSCPLGVVFTAGFNEIVKIKAREESGEAGNVTITAQNLERSLKRSAMVEITTLENQLPILATISATAPFLGLFGTVWGIMDSFSAIGSMGNTTLATVAPGIVDALVTTALGLIAAIPATIAYNHFLRKVRLHVADIETFANDFQNIAHRKFLQ